MIFGTLGCSALIFQTIFSGNPEYAWTSHVAAPIIGGSFSGMMGLGTWLPRPDIGRAWTWAEHGRAWKSSRTNGPGIHFKG